MELHGVLLEVAGCGIFIQGAAGIGKSQLGLELLDRGHVFVGDDLIHVQRQGDSLIGSGVGLSAEFLSLRCGLVVEIAQRNDFAKPLAQCSIDLVITQGLSKNLQAHRWSMLGVTRDCYRLKHLPGSAIVTEALAKDWLAQQRGHDALARLFQRHQSLIKSSA